MATTITDRSIGGSDWSMYLSLQTNSGAVDPSPVWTPFRRTDGVSKKTISRTTSNEVKTNRQGRQNIDDTSDIASELSFELTQQTAEFIGAAIHSVEDDNSVASLATIASTATGFDDSLDSAFANMEAGDWFYVTGFTDSTIDGWYKIAVKTDDGTVDTTFAPPVIEAAGATVNVESRKYASGVTQCLYAGQSRVIDDSAAGNISHYTTIDGVVNTLAMEFGESGIATGTLGIKFGQELPGTSALAGQTDAAADTSDVIGTGGDKFMAPIYIDGLPTSDKCNAKSFSLNIDNQYQDDRSAGCNGARQVLSDPAYTGNLTTRALKSKSTEWRDKYRAGTRFSVALEVKWPDGREMIIEGVQAVITEWDGATGTNAISSNEMSIAFEEGSTGDTIRMFLNNWA